MSQLNIATLGNQAGSESTPIADVINGSARAWVNFDGTGTVAIRASYNVSSITDNGTGDYTVNFTNAMPDANYSANMTITNRQNGSTVGWTFGYYSTDGNKAVGYTAGSLRVTVKSDASTNNIDSGNISVTIHR